MERGILCAGQVLAGTDWCRRDPDAWWDPEVDADRYQLRVRDMQDEPVDLLVGHWTAGEAGLRSYDDDGARLVEMMKRRPSRKRPGERLRVSIQFVVGACSPIADFAPVWQTMEIGTKWSAVHVGRGEVNARSLGVEVVSAGLPGEFNSRHRAGERVFQLGRYRDVLEFFPGQIRSFVRLANALSNRCLPGAIEIPRRAPIELDGMRAARPLSRRFTRGELRHWKGAMEHFHMDATTKLDAGTLLIAALLDNGWSGARA